MIDELINTMISISLVFFHIYPVEFLEISMDFQGHTLVYKSGSVNSYSCATFHFREHTPANLILTAGLPVQAKSPVI